MLVRGADDALYWRRFNDGWSDWHAGGGRVTSRLAATSQGSGDFHVFGRGADGALFWQRVTSGTGGGWLPLGGGTQDDPAAVADTSGVSVLVRGNDNSLYRRRFDGQWQSWQNLGGGTISAPAAVGVGSAIDVFVRGLDSRPYVQQISGGGQSGWSPLGGVVSSPMSAASDASGVTLFARGLDAQLYVKTYVAGWSDWTQLGGVPLASPPVALSSPEITALATGTRRWLRFRHVRDALDLLDGDLAYLLAVHQCRHICRRAQPRVPQRRVGHTRLGADGHRSRLATHTHLRRAPGSVHQFQLAADHPGLSRSVEPGDPSRRRRGEPCTRSRSQSRRRDLLRHGGIQQQRRRLRGCRASLHFGVGTAAPRAWIPRGHVQQSLFGHP